MAQVAEPVRAKTGSTTVTPGAVVYCVCNANHFLGAVALVNSLRLSGWEGEIIVMDCGLADEQRAVLAGETTILAPPSQALPHLLKVTAPLLRPAETMVLVDADVIVIRSLDPLLALSADSGRVIGVLDRLADRFDERWGELLELGVLRRQPYVNSGFLIAPAALTERLLGQWERIQRHVDPDRSMIGSGKPADPFYFLDQDALNGLLSSEQFRLDELLALPYATAPHAPFDGLRVVDREQLRVVDGGGREPFLLHHIQRKPWLEPVPATVYSELLARLWLADDLPIQLSPSQVPLRFRAGLGGKIGSARAGMAIASEQGRRAVRTMRSRSSSKESEAPEILWQRVEALGAGAVCIPDLLMHRLQCFEIRRRRRLGLPVADELAQDELAAIAASKTAVSLLSEARAAYGGRMLITKGYELALRYPEPWLRPFGDVDLLVEDSAEAQAALLRAGFVEVGEPSIFQDIHHLRPLWRPGSTLVIELHHQLKWPEASPPPSTHELLDRGVPSRSGVPGVLTLPDDLHALTLAAHSWAHVPLRRLLDLVDVAVLTTGHDRRQLERLAQEHGIDRIWGATIAAVDEVLRGGRRPTVAGLTWARHLPRRRDRTVFEAHLERLLSPFWAHPFPRALTELGPRLLNEVQPALHEGWRDKTARSLRATRNAFTRRTEHASQLGPAAHRHRRR